MSSQPTGNPHASGKSYTQRLRGGVGVSAIAFALTLSLPCFAQAQENGDNSDVVEGNDLTLDTVTVQARKRAESAQDVPVAITVFSEEQLEIYSSDSLQQISSMTPGLIIGDGSTQVGGAILLRGVGSGTSNPGTDQSVSINVDGIQVSQANIIRLGQFDLQQVEILKGPQALFFGKNSPAGVISLISKNPTEVWETEVTAGYEVYAEEYAIGGSISGPVSDDLGMRLAVNYTSGDGWFRNQAEAVPGLVTEPSNRTAPNQEQILGRLTLAYEAPEGGLSVNWKTSYSNVDRENGVGFARQISECSLGFAQVTANTATMGAFGVADDCELDRNYLLGNSEPALAALHPTFGDGSPYFESTQILSSLNVDYDITDSLTLTSVTGYYNIEENAFDNFSTSDLNIVSATTELENTQFTQEFRLASDFDGQVNFLAGAFFQSAEFQNLIPVALGSAATRGAPALIALPDWSIDTESSSVFAQIAYNPVPELELSIGARYTDEEKELGGTSFGAPISTAVDKISNDNTSIEATAKYDIGPNHIIYAAYKEGFVSGSFNVTGTGPTGPTVDQSFQPSTVQGFEAGIKGTALGRLVYDVTAYSYDYEDMQLSTFDPDTLSLTTVNAGEATVQGIEASALYNFASIEGLSSNVAIAYNDATYDRFLAGCYGGQSIAAGCSLNPNGTGAFQSQDLAGERLAKTPEFALTLGGLYETNVSPNWLFTIAASGNYNSEYNAHLDNDPRAEVDEHWIANASLVLSSTDDFWRVELIGRNLTNELVAVDTISQPGSGFGTGQAVSLLSDLASITNAPREVILQVTKKF